MEATLTLLQRHPDAKVVVLTTYDSDEDRTDAAISALRHGIVHLD